jgi:hypothetical protein
LVKQLRLLFKLRLALLQLFLAEALIEATQREVEALAGKLEKGKLVVEGRKAWHANINKILLFNGL